jgi:hypothetical protein
MVRLEKFLNSKPIERSGPVNSAEIQRHEEKLKLKFGPDYRRFISKFGCVASGANELYGVCGDNGSIPSAIHATISARADDQFPRNLWVIADDGSGRKFCVDSSDNLYFCDRTTCSKMDKSFEDFAMEWLR